MPAPMPPDDPLDAPDALRDGEAVRPQDARPGGAGIPAPDPGRVAGHFAGVGDGDLLDLAARDEAVRRLLGDVAVVVAEAEAEEEAGACRPLSADVRARALAAFASAAPARRRAPAPRLDDPSRPTLPSLEEARAEGGRRRRWSRVAIAAAVLLIPGVGLAVSSRGVEAASLPLEGFDRVGAGGDVETGGPRRLPIGARVEARAGERVALRLVGGTRVVLADRAQMAVGCDAPCDGGCGGAVFEIEAGGVVVAAGAGASASSVAVRVPAAGRVDVFSGAARVERDGAGAVSLSLRSDARVRWSPEGGVARELVGPAVVSLGAASPTGTDPATGVPGGGGGGRAGPGSSDAAIDAGAFRDLEFFGGPLRRMGDEVRVGCRRWRILADAAEPAAPSDGSSAAPRPVRLAGARRSEMGGAPAIRFDFDGGDVGRVAWPADAPAYGARRVEVRFRAIPAASATGGPATVRVRLEGVPGAEGSVPLDAPPASAADGEAPRLLRAILPLPASFRDAPSGLSDLVLSFGVEGGPSTVWFESVVFLEVGAADGASR